MRYNIFLRRHNLTGSCGMKILHTYSIFSINCLEVDMRSFSFATLFFWGVLGLVFAPGCSDNIDAGATASSVVTGTRVLDAYNQNPTTPLYTPESKIAIDPLTGESYPINFNRSILGKRVPANAEKAMTTLGSWMDNSGRVQITVYSSVYASQTVNNGYGIYDVAAGGVTVANDEVLVGGGAWAEWFSGWQNGGQPQSGENGAFITEAYPIDASLTTFSAKTKTHYNMQQHQLIVYAIGLKLKMDDGSWMPRATLRNYIYYNYYTSIPSTNATSTVQSNVSYPIIGGGAKINWSTNGQLLLESRPLANNSWKASSKSHYSTESCPITSYCIGLYGGNIPSFGSITFYYPNPVGSSGTYVNINQYPCAVATDMLTTDPSYVPTSFGVLSTSDNGLGRLVTGIRMDYGTNNRLRGITQSKDHISYSSGWLYTYATQIKKSPMQYAD